MCLRIRECEFLEQVKKLEGLEEVELSYCIFSAKTVRVLGQTCRRLKSFKMNDEANTIAYSDDEAMAIAENMQGLEELQVVGNGLSNKGLLAILDGCTRLRSLDLRLCFFVKLEGEIEKRCSERLTVIRRPRDSTDDYMFNRWTEHFSTFDGGWSTDGDYYDDDYCDLGVYNYVIGGYKNCGLRFDDVIGLGFDPDPDDVL